MSDTSSEVYVSLPYTATRHPKPGQIDEGVNMMIVPNVKGITQEQKARNKCDT